ncbi:MAG TPA: hypothetical protein VGO76_09250 [Luteibacter sp.]|jgi:putative protein-disulfide isomerase|nr:hypothetical protein [Luteibacter sp.]
MTFIFVADPMCSWCYGFGKELTALRESFPEVALDVVVGGLRAGDTHVMTDADKQMRLGHWTRVENASGLPFNREALTARNGFVYDTEPACRAVVTARLLEPTADQLAIFRAIQHGFYAVGEDTTDGVSLAKLGSRELVRQGYTTTEEAFLKAWQSQESINAARADFVQARRWGISSFPTLLMSRDEEIFNISPGYASVDALRPRVQAIVGPRAVSAQ